MKTNLHIHKNISKYKLHLHLGYKKMQKLWNIIWNIEEKLIENPAIFAIF